MKWVEDSSELATRLCMKKFTLLDEYLRVALVNMEAKNKTNGTIQAHRPPYFNSIRDRSL